MPKNLKTTVTNCCPYCHEPMATSVMTCAGCQASVEASFPIQRLGNLPIEHQRFIEIFVLAGGNLKVIAEQTGVSYPTIRSRLDKVIGTLRCEIGKSSRVRGSILDPMDADRVPLDAAATLIKSI